MQMPELDIADLQDRFSSGALTSAAACARFLERIEAIDRSGPTLRAVIEINPDALDIAAALDAERAARGPRGPLHGVPVMVKDSIDTGDRMMTTAGSLALVGNVAPRDAFLVAKLRTAGAVILAKTNMSEWGYMRSTRGCSGWSSRGGQTRNPYALDRSPSGSSSGSAVAVAANLCSAAIGAEVDGSIVRPASINGIVALKPTVGLVSRSGVIGVAEPQDTAGPMARSVADVAVLLSALAGRDAGDPATEAGERRRVPDYRALLDASALRGARLGVARDLMGTHEATDAVIAEALRLLRELGAELVDPANGSAVPLFGDAEMELFLYEMKVALTRYLAEHPRAPVRTIDDLVRFNRDHASAVMPYFQQEILEAVQAKGDLSEPAYARAKEECRRRARTDGIDRVLGEHRLDAIVAPTDGHPAWVIDPIVGDHIRGGCSSPAAMAGYPHVTVPAGYVHGLPVALSFFGAAWQEPTLLGFAYAFEQAARVRRPPTYPASVVCP